MNKDEYTLRVELLKLQRLIKDNNKKAIILFEGRDTAGKTTVINDITSKLDPKGIKVVSLNKPTKEERGQWYFQRYVNHFPTAGEVVFFDRSWYNRAIVEKVMGFCSKDEHKLFYSQLCSFERLITGSGTIIIKIWLDIDKDEQARRIKDRQTNILKQHKLSLIDLTMLESYDKVTKAKKKMLENTNFSHAKWHIINSTVKKDAIKSCINLLINEINPTSHVYNIDPKTTCV